ncbi:vitamin B12-dependent ribonucleotide reductase [Labrys miyagiensis]
MKIPALYTCGVEDPYSLLTFKETASEIRNSDGSLAFDLARVIAPEEWSEIAIDIAAKKYFRKAGVAALLRRVAESDVPFWLWRSVPDLDALAELPNEQRYGGEYDLRQVFDRIAGATTYWGWKNRYFSTESDAAAFFNELRFMLATQKVAPNSPQWFNTGLHWAYGIEGPSQGHYYFDPQANEVRRSANAYERPQTHSCFIQSVGDDLVNDGGVLPHIVDETRIAKYGSGTGANFSNIRGASEPLSGGGKASGLIAVLRASDRAAGLVTAGGSTRKASKMVVVDVDHPDIEDFIDWKVKEEQKVAALVTGSRLCASHLNAIMKACTDFEGESAFDPRSNTALRAEMRAARKAQIPENYILRAIEFARQGYLSMEFPVYNTDWDSAAYDTVAGQNSNNTVCVPDAFLKAVEDDAAWDLTARRDGRTVKSVRARDLWEQIGYAAWASADPGIHYSTAINEWHTSPAGGPIRASNSCSEFLFLDNTGATLASLNLLQFRSANGQFDVNAYEHVCRVATLVLEISVAMAQYPSREIAIQTYRYRPLGLGFANIGGLLMTSGIPYDSEEGRAICGALTAIMTGVSYATSAEIAKQMGPFEDFAANRDNMLRVIRNHRRAAHGEMEGYESLSTNPVPLDHQTLRALGANGQRLSARARHAWDQALQLGEIHGYRNAQASCIAPTGTIGLVMDCDTTGIEPDFALVKYKKLAGGGYLKIINRAVPEALRTLGYSHAEISEVEAYALGRGSLEGAPGINPASLKAKGFTDETVAAIDRALKTAFDIRFAFNKWTIGEEFLTGTMNIPAGNLDDPTFNLLRFLGFSEDVIEQANNYVCGTMTLEGAPYVKEEHLSVFDCANVCGRLGTRYLSVESHIRMMAAAQPFLSGAISKTINMPNEATVDDCKQSYLLSWRLALKANALYRDGSKLSQPLNAQILEDEVEEEDAVEAFAVQAPAEQIRVVAETVANRVVKEANAAHEIEAGVKHTVTIGGHRVSLRTRGDDERAAFISVDTVKAEGNSHRLANEVAVAVAVGLQHGVPIEAFISAFASRWGQQSSLDSLQNKAEFGPVIEEALREVSVDYLGRHEFQQDATTSA